MIKHFPKLIILCLFFALSACRGGFPGVFRIDIAQGNIVSQESLDKLVPGLDKQQVLYVLGTPLVKDRFNASQWDYFYYFSEGGAEPNVYRVTLYFDAERLVRVETGDKPIKDWHTRFEPDPENSD